MDGHPEEYVRAAHHLLELMCAAAAVYLLQLMTLLYNLLSRI